MSGGRERAIEALMDREPAGDFYRAARVLVRNVFVGLLLLFYDCHARICE